MVDLIAISMLQEWKSAGYLKLSQCQYQLGLCGTWTRDFWI